MHLESQEICRNVLNASWHQNASELEGLEVEDRERVLLTGIKPSLKSGSGSRLGSMFLTSDQVTLLARVQEGGGELQQWQCWSKAVIEHLSFFFSLSLSTDITKIFNINGLAPQLQKVDRCRSAAALL